jgi:hypothetical protein
MQAIIAVKAHNARCIKILTLARRSIEEETDKLVQAISTLNFDNQGNGNEQATEISNSPGEVSFTPSPTTPDTTGPLLGTTPSPYFFVHFHMGD